jgi:hypothetical protein
MYTLPHPPPPLVAQWFNHSIKQGTFKGYTVKWVGTPITSAIDPLLKEHVFILQRRHSFIYTTLHNEKFTKLPQQLHLKLFAPTIPYATHNRTHVLVAGVQVNLPLVPDDLYRTTKKKTVLFPTWRNATCAFTLPHPALTHLAPLLTKALQQADRDADRNSPPHNPFASLTTQELCQELQQDTTLQHTLDIITAFIYHYCRDTLGFTNSAASVKMSV